MASRLLMDDEAAPYLCSGFRGFGLRKAQDARTHRLDMEEFSAKVHKELDDLGSRKSPSSVAWCAVNELRAILVGKEIILPQSGKS